MFDAQKTLHIERENIQAKFIADDTVQITFEISDKLPVKNSDN